MAKMASAVPARKVWVGSLVGAATAVLVWALGLAGAKIPSEIAVSISTLLTGIVSYFVQPAETDQIV